MIKKRFYLLGLFVINLITLLSGCGEESQNDKESIRILETNIKTLEDAAKIHTFPLTIVITDKVYGDLIPENIRRLCSISKNTCKTLPIAGFLRLGSNNYYEYNCISSLVISDKIKNNEAALTDSVEKQVASYASSVKLKNFDSLSANNHADWDVKRLAQDYIGNSADSIFFFSESITNSGSITFGNKSYLIFNDIAELRKKIDEIICNDQRTISVFYNPSSFDSSPVTVNKNKYQAKGIAAGDTCIDHSKFKKLHDGKGGYITGDLIDLHSKSCGFTYPTGLAGDSCIKSSKYQKLHNGKGGFMIGNLIEKNSKDCGFVFPTGVAGDTCVNGSKYQKLHNGKGGFTVGNLIELNSRSCGFVFPTGVAGDTCIKGSKYQKLHNGKGGFKVGTIIERNSRSCGFVFPTGVAGDTCISGSKYQKLHNGKGGFTAGSLIERNSRSCGFVYPTGVAGDTCIKGSRYQKLHNGKGGFTAGSLIERNSRSCGFVFPTGLAGDSCLNGSKYQKLHNGRGGFKLGSLLERNSKDCGFKYPVAGTVAPGFICEKAAKYTKLHDGKGGFVRGTLIEANSSSCSVIAPPDNICANKSDALCEKDKAGNYTGRRVQYCYNKTGVIIRTIVVSKCDGDCRCLGN